jgi:hypothetical protein
MYKLLTDYLYGFSVVGCAVTVAPEHRVLGCHHDGMPTTRCATPATSNVTRASHVLCAGELIVLLHTGKWFSVHAVASEFRCYSLLFLDHSLNRHHVAVYVKCYCDMLTESGLYMRLFKMIGS